MLNFFYGFWDYWSLFHKVTFDGINKLIIVNEGVVELDVQRDIYSAWKEWLLIETNTKYQQALNTVGGEPTVAGQFLDVTYFLINGWKIKPQSGSYTLNIIGNLFDIDGDRINVDADINPLFPNNININTNTSVIVRQVSGGSGGGECDLTEIESELQSQNQRLFNIEDKLISIEGLLETPIKVELDTPQENILFDIYSKVFEMWKLHGLDPDNEVIVNKERRTVDSIIQEITTIDDEVKIKRT